MNFCTHNNRERQMYFSNACLVEAPPSIVFHSIPSIALPSSFTLATQFFRSSYKLFYLLHLLHSHAFYNNTDSTSWSSPKSVSMSVCSKAILPDGRSKKIRLLGHCSNFSSSPVGVKTWQVKIGVTILNTLEINWISRNKEMRARPLRAKLWQR